MIGSFKYAKINKIQAYKSFFFFLLLKSETLITWIPGKIITRSVERLINQCFLVKPRYKYL